MVCGPAGTGYAEFIYLTDTNQRVVMGTTTNPKDYKLSVVINGDTYINGPTYIQPDADYGIRLIRSSGDNAIAWYDSETDAKEKSLNHLQSIYQSGY